MSCFVANTRLFSYHILCCNSIRLSCSVSKSIRPSKQAVRRLSRMFNDRRVFAVSDTVGCGKQPCSAWNIFNATMLSDALAEFRHFWPRWKVRLCCDVDTQRKFQDRSTWGQPACYIAYSAVSTWKLTEISEFLCLGWRFWSWAICVGWRVHLVDCVTCLLTGHVPKCTPLVAFSLMYQDLAVWSVVQRSLHMQTQAVGSGGATAYL